MIPTFNLPFQRMALDESSVSVLILAQPFTEELYIEAVKLNALLPLAATRGESLNKQKSSVYYRAFRLI